MTGRNGGKNCKKFGLRFGKFEFEFILPHLPLGCMYNVLKAMMFTGFLWYYNDGIMLYILHEPCRFIPSRFIAQRRVMFFSFCYVIPAIQCTK